MRILLGMSAALILAASAPACRPRHNGPETDRQQIKDTKAYALGQAYGERLTALRDDEPALQDALLDIRARITNIGAHLGSQSARDYEAGVVDYVAQHSPEMANEIFGRRPAPGQP